MICNINCLADILRVCKGFNLGDAFSKSFSIIISPHNHYKVYTINEGCRESSSLV